MITEDVPAALDGQRLDRIVALLGDVSRSDAAAAIAAGGVTVDGAAAPSGKVRLVEGQIVSADPSTFPRVQLPQADATVKFDVTAGRIISQQMDIDKRVLGFSGPTSSIHRLIRRTEQLIAPSAKVARKP